MSYLQQVVAVVKPGGKFQQQVSALYSDVATLKTQFSTLLADAPETLDTLNEIAAAISDDPAFFTTMATANTTLQNNIDALATAAATARTNLQTALQATIDANLLTSNNAESALSGRLDALELDPVSKTYVDNAITTLTDSAPAALDTLNELAAALNDDANFATTVTNQIAAVQADVNQNETDADAADAALSARITTLEADPTTAAAVAAVQADVDQNEADADAAIAAANVAMLAAVASVQADVDQNESDADAAIALKAPLASPAFTGTTVSQTAGDTDPTTHTITGGFPDLILKTNQGDFATHQNEGRILWDDAGGGSHGAIKMKQSTGQTMDFFVGGVTAGDKVMSIASDSVDVESLKIDGTAVTSTAAELNQLDGITLGTAAQSASGDFATAAQGAKADSALQSHQDISGKANLSGATFTGNVEVSKNWPDLTLKSGDEKRLLFSDAGGGGTGAIKHVSTSLDFYASGIASGNKEFSVTASGVEVTNGVTLLNGLSEYSNDSDAATGGIPVGGLYRTMQLVKIRVS